VEALLASSHGAGRGLAADRAGSAVKLRIDTSTLVTVELSWLRKRERISRSHDKPTARFERFLVAGVLVIGDCSGGIDGDSAGGEIGC
jgi:hypothetical protein